jgi:hypothetical protein
VPYFIWHLFTLGGIILRLVEAFMWSAPLFGTDSKALMYYITVLGEDGTFLRERFSLVFHQVSRMWERGNAHGEGVETPPC